MPARSSRVTSSAPARSVRPPAPVSAAAPDAGPASAAKRNTRSANRCESLRMSPAVSANTPCIAASRAEPFTSRRRMLRESSSRTANTLRWFTALDRTTVGRIRHASTSRTQAARIVASTMRSRRRTARTRLYITAMSARAPAATSTTSIAGRTGASIRSPRWNTRGGYLKRKVGTDSNAAPKQAPNVEGHGWSGASATVQGRAHRSLHCLRGQPHNGSTPAPAGGYSSVSRLSEPF